MDPEETRLSPFMSTRRFQFQVQHPHQQQAGGGPSGNGVKVALPPLHSSSLPLPSPTTRTTIVGLPLTSTSSTTGSGSQTIAGTITGDASIIATSSGITDSIMVQHVIDDSRLLHESIALPSPTIRSVVANTNIGSGEPLSPAILLDRSLATSPPLPMSLATLASTATFSSLSSSSTTTTSEPSTPVSGVIEYKFEDDATTGDGDEQVTSTLAPHTPVASSPLFASAVPSHSLSSTNNSTISSPATNLLSGSYVSLTASDWEHRQIALVEQQRSLEAAKAAQFNGNVQMIQTLASQLSAARQRHAQCDEQAMIHEEQIRVLHEQLVINLVSICFFCQLFISALMVSRHNQW
jgi:hypothetical protein